MKSVLNVALIAPGGYNDNSLMQAFLDNGFTDYRSFDWQLSRFTNGLEGMRQKLVYEVEAYRPELVFLHVQSAEIIDEETAKRLSAVSFTVLYTFDVRATQKTEWLYQLAPHLGLVAVACNEDVFEMRNRGIRNAMVLHSSCDMDVYKKYPAIKSPNKISFVGSNYVNTNLDFPLSQERADMVSFLEKEYPDNFKAYGIGWEGGRLTNPQEEVNIYNTSAIAINHNNFDREDYTSDRLWRIMACGTFCLTKYFKGIELIFENGVHLSWWENFEQLKWQINYYLDNPIERERIASFGSSYVRGFHSWSDRVKTLMAVVERTIKLNDTPCLHAHTVKGAIPTTEEFNDAVCDCGKFVWRWEECGCTNKHYELRMSQNN